MAVRGGWRPLSGLICEIVNSVGQVTFVREFQTPMAVATMFTQPDEMFACQKTICKLYLEESGLSPKQGST